MYINKGLVKVNLFSPTAEDLKLKLTEIAALNNQIRESALKREKELTSAMKVAEKFFDSCNDTMSNLRDLKDNFLSQEPPGVDSSTVEEQQKELKVRHYHSLETIGHRRKTLYYVF